MQERHLHRPGTSLVELLLFIGILSIMAGAIVSFSLFSRRLGVHNELVAEVEQNGALVTQRIIEEVQHADIIAYPGAGGIGESLVLVTLTPYKEVAFQLFHDQLRIVENSANNITPLTSTEVGVDQLSFLHTSGANPEEATLSFAFRVWNKAIGIDAEEGQYQRQFRSTVALRPSNVCATNADCTTAPFNTCCSGVCRQACFTGCTSDSQCNTAAGQICCVTNLAAGTKSCTTLAGCSLACQIVDDCPVEAPFCAAGCEQRIPTCDNGSCKSLYAGPCGNCSFCGDGFIDDDGIDEQPGRAGVDDDGDGTIDTSGELLAFGSDDEECDDGCILPGSPEGCDDGPPYTDTNACTNSCRVNTCGDGVILANIEECDDGNVSPGDGCDALCKAEIVCGTAKLSIAFVVDSSGSMDDDGHMEGIQAAIRKFLEYMDFPKDEAMIVSTGETAEILQALSSNENTLKNAVSGLDAGGGETNLQHGLELARTGLAGATAHVKIIIVLTDGGINRKTAAGTSCALLPPPDDGCGVLAESTAAKSAGMRIFTVGIGNDDTLGSVLREVASDPDSTYSLSATTPDDILDDLAQISDAVCVCGSTTVCSATNQCVSGFTCSGGRCLLSGTVECGDGNHFDYDACTNRCFEPICGDSTVSLTTQEQCDDGNTSDGDGCSALCKREPLCGNRSKEQLEKCDDGGMCVGGTRNGMSCTKTWSAPNADCPGGTCTAIAGDGCDATCQSEEESPNICRINGESCFTDTDCNDTDTALCGNCSGGCNTTYRGRCVNGACTVRKCPDAAACPAALCCNGQVDGPEQCDEGKRCNNLSGAKSGAICVSDSQCAGGSCLGFNLDGCTSACRNSAVCGDALCNGGETCTTCPGDCGVCGAGSCGNATVDGSEQCDDGMRCTSSGDPCTSDSECGAGKCRGFSGDGCTTPTVMYENLFPNYSFENIPDFNWTASNFTWATDSNWVASDAVKSFEVFSGGYGAASNISLEANTTYRLTMDMAGNPNGGAVVKQLRVTVTDGGSLNQTFDWQFDTTGKTTSNMGWTQKSAQFSTGASPGPVMIEVREMGSDSFGPVIDNAWLFKL